MMGPSTSKAGLNMLMQVTHSPHDLLLMQLHVCAVSNPHCRDKSDKQKSGM